MKGGLVISHFVFDEIASHLFGLFIGTIGDSGVENINTYSNIEIYQDSIRERIEPFYFGTKLSGTLEFPMEIYGHQGRDPSHYKHYEVEAIQSWLFGRRESKLLSIFDEDKGNRSYDCWLLNPQIVKISGQVVGWKFNVFSKYPYSITREEEKTYNCQTTTSVIEYFNFSNVEDYLYPEMTIKLNSDTSYVRIENEQDNNRVFQLSNIRNGETIYINNKLGYLTTLSGDKILKNFNLNFFRFVDGYNKLKVSGKCIITFKSRFMKAVGGY